MTAASEPLTANEANTARRRGLTLIAAAVAIAALGWGGWHWANGRHIETTDNAYVAGNVVQITPQIGGTEPMKHVAKYFGVYRQMLDEAGHSQEAIARALDWTTHTYQVVHVAETDEQAREELEIILRSYQDAIEREAAFIQEALEGNLLAAICDPLELPGLCGPG